MSNVIMSIYKLSFVQKYTNPSKYGVSAIALALAICNGQQSEQHML